MRNKQQCHHWEQQPNEDMNPNVNLYFQKYREFIALIILRNLRVKIRCYRNLTVKITAIQVKS